jgi:hypothetical protein
MLVVYDGDFLPLASIAEVDDAVFLWGSQGIVIPDYVAQTIASWWHSPGNESAALSTRGVVTATMTMADFVSTEERESPFRTTEEIAELNALEAYINSKKSDAGMEFCHWCEEFSTLDGECVICEEEN